MIEIMEKQIKKNKYFISYYDSLKQMNKIIEALEFASDSYWGDPERFLFRAAISSFPRPPLYTGAPSRPSPRRPPLAAASPIPTGAPNT